MDATNTADELKQKIFADIAAKALRYAQLSLISSNAQLQLAVVQTSVDDLTAQLKKTIFAEIAVRASHYCPVVNFGNA